MTMNLEQYYDAYEIFVPRQQLEFLMKHDFWPDGIAYKRFVDFGRITKDRGKSLNTETDKKDRQNNVIANITINFIAFNCKKVVRSLDCVGRLCHNADIIVLQETWLLPHDIP